MKAPEKIYVCMPDDDIVGTASTQKGFPHQFVKEEYIRTDAFLEKALAWLKDFINNSEWMADDVGIAEEAVIIDSFITEMKYL